MKSNTAEYKAAYYQKNKDKWVTSQAKNPEKVKAAKAAYVERSPEKVKTARADYEARNPEKVKATKMRYQHLKRYGMTEADLELLVFTQEGHCAICLEFCSELQIDHCHSSGRVRGLLCPSCNKMLGFAKDDKVRIYMALEYLESFEGR